MDSTELNKIAGAFIGAVLLFLLLHLAASKLYGTHPTMKHHGDALAFAVEIEDTGGGEEEVVITIAEAILDADVDQGKKVFNQCKACHKLVEGDNGVGPYLYGIVGRDIAAADGFNYSGALSGMDGVWDLAALDAFLESPSGFAKGTSMSFKGLRDVEDRANVIAYLNELDGTPVDFGEAPADTEHAQARPAN
ncbi:MAG: c-type cytochrome [Pseudomonadota bacterium]